jgi:diadenosine tetraphosphate (Ap4A) HIT family hydrolase
MASIFTKIISGEIPGHFLWEDELCFSILTIMPIREGHCMVIPKQEVDHWDDVPEDTARHLVSVSQKVAKAVKAVVPCRRIGVSIVGIEVPHTHIHLMPMDTTADMDFKNSKQATQDALAATAANIRDVLVKQGFTQAAINRE